MGGQNYGTFWIKKECAPFCALFGQIMCDFELKTIGNSEQNKRKRYFQMEWNLEFIHKITFLWGLNPYFHFVFILFNRHFFIMVNISCLKIIPLSIFFAAIGEGFEQKKIKRE